MEIEIDVHELAEEMDDMDAAQIMLLKRSRAKQITDHLIRLQSVRRTAAGLPQPDPVIVWKCALNEVDVPEADQIAGKAWHEVEDILERGDIDEIRRWLEPEARLRMPRPKLVRAPQ